MKKLLLVLFLVSSAWAEPPYRYADLLFNKGMNPAAGLLAGDEPVDVQNALWDATGFMYPRSAFKLFNGRTRNLSTNLGIAGMFRYVRKAQVPFQTAISQFLAADSIWVFVDSSITDTAKGFKKEPIHSKRGTVSTTSGSAIVRGTNTRFIQAVVPQDPYFSPNIGDSMTIFRIGGRARALVKWALTDDSVELTGALDTTATNASNFKLYPVFQTDAPKSFAAFDNRIYISDSSRPVWGWDGDHTFVPWVVDSGRVYANTTTLLRDGSKAWFPNQWRSYWVRFAHRMVMDRGGAGGTDSMVRSPWVPIIANDDTTLTLKFDPVYGDAGATYYIMALPVERQTTIQTINTGASSDSFFTSPDIPSLNERVSALHTWPLSVVITDGPGRGEVRVISNWYKDTLFFLQDKFKIAPTTATRFMEIANVPIFPYNITVHQDRLWYIGDAVAKSRAYYSEPLEAGNVGPFNYIDVFPRDGDALTNAASNGDELLAFKNNSTDRIVGDNPSNFVALSLFENLGTPGINTRTGFGGGEYFYDYRSGLWALGGGQLKHLSDPVKPLLDSIPSAAAKNAALAFFKDHLWFAYPAGAGQTKNNRLLTYHISTGNWSRHTFTRAANFSVWPLSGDSSRLALGDPDSGLVYVYNDTARVDGNISNLVKLTYKTGWMALSESEIKKQLRAFHLAFDADTITGAVVDKDTLYLYKDFAAAAHDTVIFNREGQLSNYVAKDLNRENLGRLFQLEMRIAPRTVFRLYSARYKFGEVGERQ